MNVNTSNQQRDPAEVAAAIQQRLSQLSSQPDEDAQPDGPDGDEIH